MDIQEPNDEQRQKKNDMEEEIKSNTPEQSDAVQQCYQWYWKDKNAKRFYVDEMREMYKLYIGNHWDLAGPNGDALRSAEQQQNKPNVVENVTFSLVQGTTSEFAKEVELTDHPVEEEDEQAANVMTDLKKFIFYKNKINNERMKLLHWFFLYGTLIWHINWDPDWRGGRGPNRWTGDIRWKALHPMMLYPDARCKEDINEGHRCHKVVWHTLEYIKEIAPDRAHLVAQQLISDEDLLDANQLYTSDNRFDTTDQGYGQGDAKAEVVPVIETWYKGEPLLLDEGEENQGDGMHVIWWAGENQQVYLRHTNYIYFDPGETSSFPFIVKQCYPRENSVWGFGEAYHLKNPQIILNKTSETIMEGHLHNSLGQTYYNQTAITDNQKKIIREKGSLPGMWFSVRDISGIKRVFGNGVPASLQREPQRLTQVMENLIGRHDISQGKKPGGQTAYKTVATLEARAQIRLRIKEMAITAAYEEAGQYTNRLISKFYTEQRKYRVLGKGKYNYSTFKLEDFLKVYDQNSGQITPFQEHNKPGINTEDIVSQLEQDGKEVYFPEFDTECHVTSIVPADRMYHMEIAKDLLTQQIIDVETFIYVMEHGKFPPWEEVLKKYEEKQAQQAQGQSQDGGGHDLVKEAIKRLPPEMQDKLLKMPPEQQQTILKGVMGNATTKGPQ